MPTQELSPEIQKIQETVVGMYSENPWPLNRRTDEEMGWRLKCLGIAPEDYQGKKVLDMGCGTGEYALWYAKNGAASVTGIDLSDGSLAIARERKEEMGANHVDFTKMDILNCELPDNYFDYSYSDAISLNIIVWHLYHNVNAVFFYIRLIVANSAKSSSHPNDLYIQFWLLHH